MIVSYKALIPWYYVGIGGGLSVVAAAAAAAKPAIIEVALLIHCRLGNHLQ